MTMHLARSSTSPRHQVAPLLTEQGADYLPKWASNTLLFALALRFFLSPAILNLSVPYTVPGGSLLVKIHPATYLILGLAGLFLPLLLAPKEEARRSQGAAYFAFAGLVVLTGMVTTVFGTPSGVGYLVDSLLAAAATGSLCSKLTPRDARKVLLLVITYAVINAFSTYIEFALHRHLLPMRGYGMFRSAGIAGHPLETGVWCILGLCALYLLPGRTTSRFILGAALLASTATAGARLSMLICSVLLVMVAVVPSIGRTTARDNVLRGGFAAVLLALLGPLAIAVASQAGLLARFNMLGLNDESAASRILAYSVFRNVSLHDLMFGAPIQLAVDALYRSTGNTLIESSLVAYLFTFGVIGTAFLLLGFLIVVARQLSSVPRITPALIAFWTCAAGTLVLSGKSAGVVGYFAICAAAHPIWHSRGGCMPGRRG